MYYILVDIGTDTYLRDNDIIKSDVGTVCYYYNDKYFKFKYMVDSLFKRSNFIEANYYQS